MNPRIQEAKDGVSQVLEFSVKKHKAQMETRHLGRWAKNRFTSHQVTQ